MGTVGPGTPIGGSGVGDIGAVGKGAFDGMPPGGVPVGVDVAAVGFVADGPEGPGCVRARGAKDSESAG